MVYTIYRIVTDDSESVTGVQLTVWQSCKASICPTGNCRFYIFKNII